MSAARSALLTIGQVLGELRPDFPDVSHSKIRFLEDRGLVRPQRTPSGYRKYSPTDVDRLRFVLECQRDRYLPLKVIGEHLAALDRGGTPPAFADPVASTGPMRVASPARDTAKASRADLDAAAGGDAALVDALLDHALITLDAHGGAPGEAADVVRAVRELAASGIEPRHLRPLRTAIEREAALVEQVVSPLRRQLRAGSAERAEEVEGDLVGLMLRLHAAMLRTSLEGGSP